MVVDVLFHTASTPKRHRKVYSVYTKDSLLCLQMKDGLIIKYPLINVFCVCHRHSKHLGTTRR